MAKVDVIKGIKDVYKPLEDEISRRELIYSQRSNKWQNSDKGDDYWSNIYYLKDILQDLRTFMGNLIIMDK